SVLLDGSGTDTSHADSARILTYEWRPRAGNPATLAGLPAQGQTIEVPAPTVDGEYYATLRVTDSKGRSNESPSTCPVRSGSPETSALSHELPAWVDSAVVYGIVPFLFGDRGLPDVTARLDDLVALGVTVLWLSPITAAPPGDFGYAVIDYFGL